MGQREKSPSPSDKGPFTSRPPLICQQDPKCRSRRSGYDHWLEASWSGILQAATHVAGSTLMSHHGWHDDARPSQRITTSTAIHSGKDEAPLRRRMGAGRVSEWTPSGPPIPSDPASAPTHLKILFLLPRLPTSREKGIPLFRDGGYADDLGVELYCFLGYREIRFLPVQRSSTSTLVIPITSSTRSTLTVPLILSAVQLDLGCAIVLGKYGKVGVDAPSKGANSPVGVQHSAE